MRTVLAWFLLLITALQWVGGYPCFKGAVSVVVERSMSAAEELLSQALEEELGLKAHLRMHTDPELLTRGSGYSAYFYFPRNLNEELAFFSFTPASEQTELLTLKKTLPQPSDQDTPTQISELQFPDFIPASTPRVQPIQAKFSERSNFAFLNEPGLPSLFLETPPPEQA
jgi:hypothetical protein